MRLPNACNVLAPVRSDTLDCAATLGRTKLMNHLNNREKLRGSQAKRAVALAMQNRWSEAAAANLSIVSEFPNDLEAYNRLGKAQTELGRISDARVAFQRALEISPHNPIAKKNLSRLTRLGAERGQRQSTRVRGAFVEEGGKAIVTPLARVARGDALLQMAPGHPVQLHLSGGGIIVEDYDGEYLGQLESRLSSRLTRLIDGGNRYEAMVTSTAEDEIQIIIREIYKHPSQTGALSFPARRSIKSRVGAAREISRHERTNDDTRRREPVTTRDWSDDEADQREAVTVTDWSYGNTEPSDNEAFSPTIHRIITANGNDSENEDL